MTTATIARTTPQTASVVRRAVRDILPIAFAVAPFGSVVGVTLAQAGLTGAPALIGTVMVYAGSAQLATLSVMIGGGAPLGAIAAGVLINARLLLYSAGLSRRFGDQPRWFRWIGPLTTVDQTFALATAAEDLDTDGFRRYWITIGAVLALVWLTAVSLGLGLGSLLPDQSPLAVAAPATMIALLVPHLGNRRMRRVALIAATVAATTSFLPSGLGVIAAIGVALAAAGSSEGDGK